MKKTVYCTLQTYPANDAPAILIFLGSPPILTVEIKWQERIEMPTEERYCLNVGKESGIKKATYLVIK
jgi:hypothetical protein